MTEHVTILRGLPTTSKVPAAGRPYRGLSLACRVGTYLHFAGTSPDDAFGAVLVARGRLVLHALLVVPDETDAATLGRLRRWGERHPVETVTGPAPWRVVTVSAYFAPKATREGQSWAFVPNAYTGTGPVVGCDLGRSFGLIAEHVEKRRGRATGSWQVWPPGWGRPRPEKKDIGKVTRHRPSLYLASRRVGWSVTFRPCERGDGSWTRNGVWRGEFVDLLSTAYALDADRGAGFIEHSRNFGLVSDELPVTAPLDAHGAALMAAAVGQVHAFALRLDDETARWFTGSTDRKELVRRLPAARLHSPAAIADHLLRQFGCSAPLARFGLDEGELAHWWEAYHGGWNDELAVLRGRPFGAVVLDITSAYPLVAHLIGWWNIQTAARMTSRVVTDKVRVLADRVTADPRVMLDPATWSAAAMILVELVPDEDVLPVAIDDPHRPDGRTETVPVIARGRTMFYSLFDVLASGILTGRSPASRIVRAVQFVPVGRQEGLRRRVPFLPGLVLDVDDDPAVALVGRRRQAKAESDTTLASLLHAAVNSLVSGKPAELHDVYRKVGEEYVQEERNAVWTFPPLAVTVTAGARLLLAVLDRMVRDRGGIVAYRDTDSSIIPASPDGGTITLDDGSSVEELTYAELREVVGAFDALSPDPGHWPVWKMDPKPGEDPLRCVIFGPKRHAEYRGADDAPELIDWTETGLGGMWSDPAGLTGRCAEGGRAWSQAAVEREVRYAAAKLAHPDQAARGRVPWDAARAIPFPTLRRLAVTSPTLLAKLPASLGARVGSRYLEAVIDTMVTQSVRAVVALDPGGGLDDWASLHWIDRQSGEPVPVSTDMAGSYGRGSVILETLSARAGRYGAPPDGEPVSSVLVTPLSVRYAGRVSPVIDSAEDGEQGDLARFRLRYEDSRGLGPGQRDALVNLAASLPAAEFARLAGTTPRVARRIASGNLPRGATVRNVLAELRRSGGALLVPGTRTCSCGCGDVLPANRRSYVDDAHRERSKKRRQRAVRTRSHVPGPAGDVPDLIDAAKVTRLLTRTRGTS